MIPSIIDRSLVDKAVQHFEINPSKNNSDFGKYLLEHVSAPPSFYDQYSFFGRCLEKKGGLFTLACFYAKSGRIDEAIETAKKLDDPKKAALFYLKKGDLANSHSLSPTPSKNCSDVEIVGWIQYHTLNGTLETALEGYEHENPSLNGFVSIAKRDYEKAAKDLANCRPIFKLYSAYALTKLNQIDKAIVHLTQWVNVRDISPICFIDEFELWSVLYPLTATFDPLGSFSLVYNYFLSIDSRADSAQALDFIIKLKVMYNTPSQELILNLRTRTNGQSLLSAVLSIQKDAAFNENDLFFFNYCHINQKFELLVEYCEIRKRETGAWQFDEEWVEAKMLLHTEVPPEVVIRMHELCDQSNQAKRPPCIQEHLGYYYLQNNKYALAQSFLIEHGGFYGKSAPLIVAMHSCLARLNPNTIDAEIYITSHSKSNKHLQVLEIVYQYRKDKPISDIDRENQDYHAGFKMRVYGVQVQSLEEELRTSSKTESALDNLELSTIPINNALNALRQRLKKQITHFDLFLYAFFLFENDQKIPALFDLKRIDFDKFPAGKLSPVLKKIEECDIGFLVFASKYLPNEGKIILITSHMKNKEHDKANALTSEVLRKQPNHNYAAHLKVLCLLAMKRPNIARTFIEDYNKEQANSGLSALLPMVNAAIAGMAEAPKPEAVLPSSKNSSKPPATNTATPLPGFVTEKPRTKEERVEKVVRHNFGGTKQKGGIDPIHHASGFDPKKYKPKEDARDAKVDGKKENRTAKPTEALVKTKISAHYKKTLDHARTLVLKAIHLKERYDKKEIDEDTLINNLLYTYLRVFEIISFKTIDPELLKMLQNRRVDARHHFNLIPLKNAISCLQYLIDIKLEAQLFLWLEGTGTLNHLVLSVYPLVAEELELRWNSLSHIEKDAERMSIMKTELKHLIKFMESVKTEGVFAGDGPNENGAKMSIMKIGKCWSQLRSSEKEKLAPYFRPFNLEGNRPAHQFKYDSEQDHIKFMHLFEDIPLENMWKFAQDAPILIAFLDGCGS